MTEKSEITAAAVESFAGAPDARLKAIMQAMVRHTHAFLTEVSPTIAEWETAIGFLTKAGHITNDKRQEFILLSDVLGISMLVDAINHPTPDGATETTVLGPFYLPDLPEAASGTDISRGAKGTPMFFSGTVLSTSGQPVDGARIDVWQSDDDGYYDVQKPGDDPELRARFRADGAGQFHFRSITPTSYPIPNDGPVGALLVATHRHPYRPAHVHFMIAAPGFETLVTHLFVGGDPYLDSDVVFGVKPSLIVDFKDHEGGTAPDGQPIASRWQSHSHVFGLKPSNV